MIRIRDILLPPEHNPGQLTFEASRALRISPSEIRRLTIVRRSIDARKKPDVKVCYTVDVLVAGSENKVLKKCGNKKAGLAPTQFYRPPAKRPLTGNRPVIIGFGPAGMFAGLILAMAGQKPIVLERGDDAATRHEKVRAFFDGGALDTVSNVQFGEGGAGTFSDGKLNTGVNNVRIGWVLSQMVRAGAYEDILYDAKPHVGTDVLLTVVQNIRKTVESLGGEVRFRTQVTEFLRDGDRLTGVKLASGEEIKCDKCILAIGHSARDTFETLHRLGIPMEPKPFAMGVRIEHRQSAIDKARYGVCIPALPPADYKLVTHLDKETVYTFCMCPGGHVVAAASEEGGIVTNGMSNQAREGENANAALLVTVNPEEFPYEGALGGMYWQREIERRCFAKSGSYRAPAQKVGDFLQGRPSAGAGDVKPSYEPGVTWCDLHTVLPSKLTDAIAEALPKLEGSLRGFSDPDAVMTAPETRSSSPVRIVRDDTRQSTLRGLYPCGEGAGYAGGIMSAALDGIQTAEALLEIG